MRSKLFPTVAVLSLVLSGACRQPAVATVVASGVDSALEDRWEEAVRYWKKALDQNPDSASARNNLAVAYEKRGAWEDARKEYEAALRIAPDNATIKDNFERFKARLEAARGRTP
jgi:Flp pilus assembly protein TadD